ncbi:GBS Bsp-like repeat-containing protein [Streptococcus sp. NSJ-72]|uniref:LD-carboxypeptidase LdcB/DacB n=1 Tax=Streptococcus sp. NSJ-72 TaxID=2763068 RepID=UPI001650E0DA|nr:LD-carboxypeptidase LdcB/DacB [Streptococcus sp. NSJ-72]QNL42544.1 GBS Bsp-like repeat-containing protein [Streptococcus sp. NSJ-72]
MKKMFDHKEQRFSIRKYSCGAASVLIGCVLFMGGQAVSADEQVTTDTSIETSQVNTAAKNNIQNTTGSTAVAPQTATTQKETAVTTTAPTSSSADKAVSVATETTPSQTTTVDAATQTEDETTNSSVDATTDTADSSTTAKVEKSPVEKEARKEEIDVAKLMDKTQTAQQARLAESKVAQSVPSLPSQGYYTYTKRTEVKNEPKASAALQFYVNAGDRVYYDRVLVADGYQWLSYRSYSGIRRYAAINKLVTEPVQPAKPTPSSTGTLPSRGRYTFSETAEVKNEAKWSAPTQFTFNRGDSVNYDKVLENDGYQWISYISYSGMRRYAAVTKLAQPAPQRPAQSQVTGTIHIENKTSQGFDVVVTNVSSTKGVKTVKLPIWSSQGGQDDVIWYDAIKQTDGTYKLSVDIRRHKNNRGEYNIHMYYIQSDGSLQGVTGTTTKVEEPKYSVTGTIHIENKTSQGFDVLITNVSDSNGISRVKVPIWTENSGQDDIIWYDASKQNDGNYKVTVNISKHKNESGEYNIHLYYIEPNGKIRGVSGTKTTVVAPSSARESIPSQGVYTFKKEVEVKNSPTMTAKTEFTFARGERIRYDKVLDADHHQWISYVSYSGTRRYIPIATLSNEETPKPVQVTGTIHIENKTSQGFDVVVTNVSSTKGVKTVKLPVWSSQGGQDDVIWYDAVKQTDGSYKLSVDIRRHKNNRGEYNIHMYYVQSDGSLQGVTGTTTKVEEPKYSVTGTIHIENKTSQGFDVVVTDVSSTKGVKTVKLPVWSSQGGQDDVIWYDAAKQTDGSYKLSVDIRRHKNNRGEYNIHMYYVQSDGSLQGVTGTTTKVEGSQTSVKEVQYNGSYYFVQGKYDEIVVANKKHPMAANYNPGENPTAKAAFLRLRNDMIAQGYNVGYAYSRFRSYDYQKVLYQNYVNKDGQAAADRYSARPGYSEHQTGLVFDLTDKAGNLLEDAAASTWLKNNAHRYGFVVRYQPGKEASTGYMPEAWHIRYIGKEADEIYHSGLSLEEYYGFEGGDYVTSATTPKPSTPSSQKPVIPAQGVYRFTKRSSIKAEPRMSAPELAYYNAGQSVTYDKVLNADGVTWISYIAFSGKRRYIAIA